METLLPLEDYEADPAFSRLSPVDKDKFYSNYYTTATEEASSEDDYNTILKYKADRSQSALKTNYQLMFPEDTKIDVEKIAGTTLEPAFLTMQNSYGQLDSNQNAKVNKYSADDMEVAGREFAYKQFQFGEKRGYSVKYPDGTMESITGPLDDSQLTEYLRKNRLDKFNGKREGIIDSNNPMADTEFDMIYDKMRKTDGGIKGNFNAIRSSLAFMGQSIDLYMIKRDRITSTAEDTLEAKIEASKERLKDPNLSEDDRLELLDHMSSDMLQTGVIQRPDQRAYRDSVKDSLPEKYKELAESIQESEKIRGTRILSEYNDHIMSLTKDKRGEFSSFTDYFKRNPLDFAPYLTSIAVSSAPNTAAIIGTAAVTGAVTGSPLLAGGAAGAVGFQMEYTGTLLSEMQNRAAEEGKTLYGEGVLESYIDDSNFMRTVEEKAMVRAGIIGTVDAVTGGASELIVQSIKGGLKRAGASIALGVPAGAGGEAAAQQATEGKLNWTEILNEGIGELGGAPMTVARGVMADKAAAAKAAATVPATPLQQATSNAQASIVAATSQAQSGMAQGSRIDAIKEKYGITTPEVSQSTEAPVPEASDKLEPIVPASPTIVQSNTPQEFNSNLDQTVSSMNEEQAARVAAGKASFDRKDEGEKMNYKINGIQKGFNDKDEYVPMYQMVTIDDPTHYFDGSTIMVPLKDGVATPEDISDAIEKKADQEATDKARLAEMDKEGSVKYDSGIDSVSPEVEISDASQLTEKGPGLLFRAFDWYNEVTGRKPKIDKTGQAKIDAANLLNRSKSTSTLFSILSDTQSYNRVMTQAVESNYDASAQGRLMGLFGLSQDDSKRRVLTNVLGNFWTVNGNPKTITKNGKEVIQPKHIWDGLAMSEAVDAAYRADANVDSIYDMSLGKLNEINKNDLFLAMAPDGEITDPEGWVFPVQSQAYSVDLMSVDESVERFNSQFNATPVRAPKFDASLNDKYVEASSLKRPGMMVLKLSDVKGTVQERAKYIDWTMKDAFVIKDAKGDNGRNIFFSVDLKRPGLEKNIQDAIDSGREGDVYYETMMFPRTGKQTFNEHRIHLYVDKKGKAHAFRNLTFNKNDTLYAHDREALSGNADYDTHILIPGNVNDPKITAMQEFAEKAMSGKGFSDMIFGLDVGESQDMTGKEGNTIFEANALTYGMSGFLGNPIAMSEIISEMTGKPSVMAGLYELAKTSLSKEEIADVKSRVDQGMPTEYAAHPEYYDSINRGIALFNKYLPSGKWMEAMKNLFTLPVKFLTKLYAVITDVFKSSVDRRFEAQQRSTSAANFKRKDQSTENSISEKQSAALLMPKGKDTKLSTYIDQVLQHPKLTKAQRAVLSYIKKKVSSSYLNDITVGKTSLTYNYYSTSKSKIGLKSGGLTPRIALHEISHAVTSDLIEKNFARIVLLKSRESMNDYYENPSKMRELYLYITDPENEKKLLRAGVQKDFIELAKTYWTFVSDLGFGGEDTQLGAGNVSYEFQMNNPKIPYGAVNMDEFVAEVLSKEAFQKKLAQLPPTKKGSRTLYSQVMQIISRLLGIPFNHGGTLLSQAVIESLSLISKNQEIRDKSYMSTLRPSSPESEITSVNGMPFIASEISAETQAAKQVASTDAQKESVELQAQIESLEARIADLKSQSTDLSPANQERMKGIEPIPANLPQMREVVIDDLNEKQEAEKVEDKYPMTEKRMEYINELQINKALALNSLSEWINDSRITDGQADILLDSIEYVMERTEDPENLSTNNIKYMVNVLQSMSDGGPPIGFKYIAPKMFTDRQVEKLNAVRKGTTKKGKERVHLQGPIGDWRREIVFGIFGGKLGSTAHQSSEISYMGLSPSGKQFLQDFMGYYKDNIDLQNLEERAVKEEFYQTVRNAFPKGMRQLQAKRIGVVARLSQYEKTKPNPQKQILSRLNQIESGLEVEMTYKKEDGELSNLALKQILNGANLSLFPDEKSIISFLRSQLTPAELMVLDKTRDIGRVYMPALQTVKAITKQTSLQEFENYVHDLNVTPNEEVSEQSMLKAFTSMSDILHDRKGINTSEKTTFAELDITAIADKQIKSSTYEKHTGMQRYMLANALAAGSPLTDLLDADTDIIKRPITNRLRSLLASYHHGMTTTQHQFTGVIGLYDALVNAYVGTKIVGVNAFVKNAVSSSVARFSLQSLSPTALRDSMTYDHNRPEINEFLKANFPTQYNRTNEYDIIEGMHDRYSAFGDIKRNKDIGHSAFFSVLRTFPSLPRKAVQQINDTILTGLSNVSNGYPEKYSAHAIWTSAYVHYMKKNGTVVDMNDFLARKPVDRRAANDANDFVNNALGYSADKANKGTYWNGSTATKKVISKAFSVFRQQSTGLNIEFQNNVQKAARLFASGNIADGYNALKLARVSMANSMSFRGLTIALSGSMLWGGIDRFFNASDEEEKKRKLMEAKRKYTENANRNNMRDFISESLLMIAPVATSAMLVENATAGLLDKNKLVIGFTNKGFDIERKQNIRKEIDVIKAEIDKLEKAARSKVKLGLNTSAEDDAIEKLEITKSQLTEKFSFKYFPSQSDKAMLSVFGSYGIAEEFINKTIDDMIGDDLDTEEKIRLKQSLANEFSYNDPIAGIGYGLDQVNDLLGYARKFVPEFEKDDKSTPNSLFWMQYMKVGQNPKVVIDRARLALAQDAVRKAIAAEAKALRIEKRWADKYRE